MSKKLLIISSTALTLALSSQPLQAQISPDCRSPQTQSAMNQCSALDYQRADNELNRVYNQLFATLTRDRQEQLTTVQLSWLQFRDEHCDYVSSRYEGGSIQPLMLTSCLAELTQMRTEQLRDLLRDQ